MIIWENTVFSCRSPMDIDAHRVKDELKTFLMENQYLGFGNYSMADVCDVVWELSANAGEWSRALSAPVVLETGDHGLALHVRDGGVGVEEALGRTPEEAFTRGVTSSTIKYSGRGGGLAFLLQLTEGGGTLLMETGDISIVCMDGRIVSTSKSVCYVKGTAVSFFCDPTA